MRPERRESRCSLPPASGRIVLMLFLLSLLAPGCRGARIVRVPVTAEDILRANLISQEGEIAFNRRDYYAALIKYLEAIRINPNNEHVYNRIGMTYTQLSLFDEATAAFEHSIGLNSKYAYPYNNLGAVLFAQRNFRKSEKYFKKAIKLKQDEASFHMNLASVYLERKKPVKAMAEWRRGLAIDPAALSSEKAVNLMGGGGSFKERSYYIARLHASLGNVEPAITSLKEAIEKGFDEIFRIQKEPDFDPIRKDERFSKFMEEAPMLIKLRESTDRPPE